jgi:hypothetical protein
MTCFYHQYKWQKHLTPKEFSVFALCIMSHIPLFHVPMCVIYLQIISKGNSKLYLIISLCVSFPDLPCFMLKLFQLLMCIAITILRVNEAGRGCALIYKSHSSSSQRWGVGLGDMLWEEGGAEV